MSFPRYPKYKGSGVEWLGEVPEHWGISRLKNLFDLMRRPPKDEDEIVTAFRDGEVTLRSNRRTDGFTNAVHEHGYQRILKGDLVIHAMDAFAGAIGVSDSVGKSTPVYSVCTPKHAGIDPYYYGRLLRHMALSGYINSLAKGIRERSTEFRWNEAANVILSVPPLTEQIQITTVLDRETAKIDALVGQQQRLIDLLKEKRQAIIYEAITKGLNPDAPKKLSGIEWIGDVPAHWSVIALKHVCRIESGHTPQKSNEAFWVAEDCCIPWISLNDTKTLAASDFIDDTVVKISALGMQNSSAHLIESGAVVMNRDGARVGLASITTKPMCVSQHIIAWVCGVSVCNHFLLHVLYAMNDEIYRLAGGATIPTIGMPDIREMTMPLPPLSEQNAIVDYLLNQRHRLDALITEAKRAIDLLQERRIALISAAVTGKIDVRSSLKK